MTAGASGAAGLRTSLEELLPKIGAESVLKRLRSTVLAPVGDRANVVVVGEPNTGKTSIINALLGRPGLLPVRPTNVYAAVGGNTTNTMRVHYADGRTTTDEIAHLGTLLEPDDGEVDHVELGVNDPRLDRLTLFDTPGVGGIDTAASQLTLTAVQRATALVFVCSAAAKISIAERSFLAEAAARIDQIVFVLSKIDQYGDFGEVLAENIETIHGDFRRFPPNRFDRLVFIPFSAELADDPDLADESGVDALWAQLSNISAEHDQLIELNALRAVATALREAEAIVGDRLHALDRAAADDRELSAVTAQITELTQANASWRSNLSREFDAARDAVRTRHRRRTRRLKDAFDAKLAAVETKAIPHIEAGLVAELNALQDEAVNDVRQQVTEVARGLLAAIPGGTAAADELGGRLPSQAESPSDYLSKRPDPPKDPSEALVGIQTTFLGANIARTLITTLAGASGIAAGTVVVPAVVGSVPAGLLWWRLQRKLRRRAADLARLRAEVNEWIAEAKFEISEDIDRAFRDASHILQDAIGEAFSEALDSAKSAQKDVERARDRAYRDGLQLNRLKAQLEPLQQSWESQRQALLALPASSSGTSAGAAGV